MYKDLLFQVVDPEQEFDKNYCGIDEPLIITWNK